MEITSTAEHPSEKCCLDIVGSLIETDNGNKCVLTIQDDLSKYVNAVPIRQQDADIVSRELVAQLINRFGIPVAVFTDQGANFLSEIFKYVCKLLKLKKIQIPAFYPESNGELERSHSVLRENMTHSTMEDQRNWDHCIPTQPLFIILLNMYPQDTPPRTNFWVQT